MRHIDLSAEEQHAIRNRVMLVTTPLFEAVKRAPVSLRQGFPQILQSNNFGIAAHILQGRLYLEVTSKRRLLPGKEIDRVAAYKSIVAPPGAPVGPVLFNIAGRSIQIAKMELHGLRPVALAQDASACLWDVVIRPANHSPLHVDLLYVVGFGQSITPETVWVEIDAFVRRTLADWSRLS